MIWRAVFRRRKGNGLKIICFFWKGVRGKGESLKLSCCFLRGGFLQRERKGFESKFVFLWRGVFCRGKEKGLKLSCRFVCQNVVILLVTVTDVCTLFRYLSPLVVERDRGENYNYLCCKKNVPVVVPKRFYLFSQQIQKIWIHPGWIRPKVHLSRTNP